MEITYIDYLPVELFIDVLIKTDGKTVGKCRRVSKKWKSIIDNTDLLWEKLCLTEFRHPSRIAKEKCHSDCKWYHIYRNLIAWNDVTHYKVHLRDFQDFPLYEFVKKLNLVTLNRNERTENTVPFLFKRNCPKIANNDHALVVFFKFALIIIRPVENTEYVCDRFYRADGYSLSGSELYFYRDKEVFLCDLLSKDLQSKSLYNSEFKIKEIQHYNGQTFIFTQCGRIVVKSKSTVKVQPINCPQEWIKQIKQICAIDNRNYICYSGTLFKIETEKYRHLYLEMPPITALFFYGDFVLLGTKLGEILLYRLLSQKSKYSPPIFEFISQLPDNHYAVQLDVCERKSGPLLIVTTMFKIMFLEIDFFADDKDDEMPLSVKRLKMYKILVKIKDALNNE